MNEQKVILIDVISPLTARKEADDRMIESENLVRTYWGFVIIKKIQRKLSPDYQTFIGKWKLDEIKQDCLESWAKLIIVNNVLKPKQIYNLEREFEKDWIKVWTRVDLILKIFEKHAVSTESKLQIELAAIKHMWPRIFGMGLELSRQWWGIWTSWVWETNTELMKRHLAELVKKIKEKLKLISNRHELHRNARARKNLSTVAIVGYTNAWKSQLLTSITKKKVKVKDELFATLDTRIWELYLPNLRKSCLVSDTIGFIQDLPPWLIEAFANTLDETVHCDLILHVVDYSDPKKHMKIKVVLDILAELWVWEKNVIMVCNKIDLVKNLKTKAFSAKYKRFNPIFVSALNKTNTSELVSEIEKLID